MGAGFLFLAAAGESSGQTWVFFGPLMILLIIVLVVLAIVIAVLARFARRRLIDEPVSHKTAESPDPWVEAGRRIAQPLDRRAPPPPPEPTEPDPTPDDDDGATP